MSDAVKSGTNHYDPLKKEAASKIMIVLDQYGNIRLKSRNEKTGAVTKLMKELTDNYLPECQLLELTNWIDVLAERNNDIVSLTNTRYHEVAKRTALRMKEVRIDIDIVFRNLLARVDALVLINGPADYEPFVREINARIEKFKASLAIRKRKSSQQDEDTEK